ncbi:MAG: polysulfide reductase NrfD [Anaerolineales bacterium]|nr:polysulfide reductase NrfD [Anaerolineales bacterium]
MKIKSLVKNLSRFHYWLAGLSIIMVIGVIGALIVFAKGLVVTNLTDLVPWGLWITIDLSAIALSAGAFTLCAAVYLVGLKEYQPVARTATFIGIIGYSMAMLCLLMDIGRPDRFWHAFVFWNVHSVLWEVTMCVGLYFIVLTLETLPIIGGADWFKERWPKLSDWLTKVHHYAPYLAIAGLFLSMLHQSSLGATYGVLKARPLWYSPSLSVLFMFSAIVGGISLTVLASMLAARLSEKANVDDRLLEKLSHFIGWALVVYLYFRFWYTFSMTYTYELGRTEGLSLLTKGPLAFNFWLGEIILGALVPMIILLKKDWRARPWLRMAALALVVGGLVAYRWDVNLSGQMVILTYLHDEINAIYTSYMPNLIEVMVGAGVVAFGLMAFTLGVQYLKVVNYASDEHPIEHMIDPVLAPGD